MYEIAAIVSPHGLKGEVNLRFFGENVAALKSYGCLWIDDTRFLTIKRMKHKKPGFIIGSFEEIQTRDQAEDRVKTLLYLKKEQLSPLQEDIFYHQHLIGCHVLADETLVGQVYSVSNYGGDDILEMEEGRVLFRKESVLQVDIDQKKIWVNPNLILWDKE